MLLGEIQTQTGIKGDRGTRADQCAAAARGNVISLPGLGVTAVGAAAELERRAGTHIMRDRLAGAKQVLSSNEQVLYGSLEHWLVKLLSAT